MPGAIIAIDQDRPGGSTSFGTPGVARNDLWQNRTIRPRSSQSGNLSQQWTLLSAPSGSTAVINNDTSVACNFDPDLPGTYRIQLTTNGGGTGNIQILVARVRFDTNGALTNRGYALPAIGEVPPEANYPTGAEPSGNTRGWDEPWEFILADLLAFITGGGGGFTAGGDLDGDNVTQTVIGFQGRAASATPPTDKQVWAWSTANNEWEPSDPSAVPVGGDASGTSDNLTVEKLSVLAGGGSVLVGVDNDGNLEAQPVAPIAAGFHTGTDLLDFGAAPGGTNARVTISGQTGLLAGSTPKAWIMYKDSADHTMDEHLAARIYVIAGNISGTSFDIVGLVDTPIVGRFNVAWEWY